MSEDETETVAAFFQKLIPLTSSLLLLFISYLPFNFPLLNNIRPEVGMICVYFWMIHRPDVFNLFSVFTLGVLDDIIANVPLGCNIFALLLYVLFGNFLRFIAGKPFIVTWYGFMLLSLITLFGKWFVMSVYYGQFLPISIVFFSYLVTIAFYPLFSLILAFVQNNLMADEE